MTRSPAWRRRASPVRITIDVDPEAGEITVDVRDNMDNVPGGLNLSENTCTGSCRIGVFNNLDDGIPHNEGAKSRIKVLMREGSVVGKPPLPP
ncbi:hydantoinase B/oxoprolinase family protein [Mesorhizobium sp. C386A]|uniref:hydantoinase B/oxoprolinase family protein n=1 Tax=Mesorhizobium sp. C386A TaxID=2956831 RepID=UPI00333656DC